MPVIQKILSDPPFIPYSVLKFMAEQLEGRRWIFAKTMAWCPHWYTLREDWMKENSLERKKLGGKFEQCCAAIYRFGYKQSFGKAIYDRFDINGWKYWVMGWPPDETDLINRATREYYEGPYQTTFSSFADSFDRVIPDTESDHAVLNLLGDVEDRRILDINCQTGHLLDYRCAKILSENWVGTEQNHLLRHALKRKHPGFHERVVGTRFESCVLGTFDLIVALRGSASFIDPLYLSRIPEMLNPGGRFVLTFYRGAQPRWAAGAGVISEHFVGNEQVAPGDSLIETEDYFVKIGTVPSENS